MIHRSFSILVHRLILFPVTLLLAAAVSAATASGAPAPTTTYPERLDVPYVPTPHEVVARMLDMADVQSDDFVVDLGSGDGRIAIAAVRDRGAKGAFGVDLNPVRVEEAWANAKDAGVDDRVTFRVENLFDTDFSMATVVTMYLLPSVNLKLRPRLLEMPPGTRIVSHAFDMDDWYADEHARVNNLDVYLWIVPEQIEGQWIMTTAGGDIQLDISQTFQEIQGVATLAGSGRADVQGQLRGDLVQFDIDDGRTTQRYVGRVMGDAIEPVSHPGAQRGWRAQRN